MTNSTPSPTSGGIRLQGLSKTFRSNGAAIHAVRGIDIHVAPGETVALLGPNGAGKSTTIDMMLGLTRPDSGSVSVFGTTPDQAISRGMVGAMMQTGQLIKFITVRELLLLVGSLYPHPLPLAEVLAATGIDSFAGQRTDKLSGGQTQRVRAAMALITNPELLILDEPTVAMDVEGRHTFWTSIRAYAQAGKTVLFATHYLEEADQYADRIIVMAHGSVVADGTPNEIKAKVGVRTIRATIPGADLTALGLLPGVTNTERHGELVILACDDSDSALRALLPAYPAASGIEVSGGGLEQAFLTLTGESVTDPESEPVR